MARVFESAVIDAPIDVVWRLLRDFNSHAAWHPAIAASRIEDDLPADTVGAVRAFSLRDGGQLREQLLRLDDRTLELSYCLLEAPLPLHGYVATIRLKPLTDAPKCLWIWSSTFNPPPARAVELERLVAQDIYRAGFRALEAYVNRGIRVERRAPEPAPAMRPSSPPAVAAAMAAPATIAGAGRTTGAIVMTRHGGPDVLEWQTVEVPAPGPGQVTIRQSHIGVNFIDIYCRTGYFNLVTPPGIPGMEAAGVVEDLAPDVTWLAKGDLVGYACAPPGAYTGLRTMDADLVMRLPPHLPPRLAAASLLKGATAAFLLHDIAPASAGDMVIVHAAAGGVGSLLTQWASALGAHVIATVSTHEKVATARRAGARDVIIGRGPAFVDAVAEITGGRGARVIYDAVGKDSFSASLQALAIRGHLVSYGQASGAIGPADIGALASKSVTLSRPNYGHYTGTRADMALQFDRLQAALAAGLIRLDEPTLLPLAEAARAHSALENSETTGAIVLTVDGDAR